MEEPEEVETPEPEEQEPKEEPEEQEPEEEEEEEEEPEEEEEEEPEPKPKAKRKSKVTGGTGWEEAVKTLSDKLDDLHKVVSNGNEKGRGKRSKVGTGNDPGERTTEPEPATRRGWLWR
jgi:DNA polymerase II small subunit/DNA polymerase delta subunit B